MTRSDDGSADVARRPGGPDSGRKRAKSRLIPVARQPHWPTGPDPAVETEPLVALEGWIGRDGPPGWRSASRRTSGRLPELPVYLRP